MDLVTYVENLYSQITVQKDLSLKTITFMDRMLNFPNLSLAKILILYCKYLFCNCLSSFILYPFEFLIKCNAF